MKPDAPVGESRAQRQVNATRLEDAQQGDDPADPAIRQHAHHLFRRKSVGQEPAADIVRRPVQLAIAQPLIPGRHGHRVGGAIDLGVPEVDQRRRLGPGHGRSGSAGLERLPLLGTQHVQVVHRPIGIGQHLRHQCTQLRLDLPHPGRGEDGRIIGQGHVERGAGMHHHAEIIIGLFERLGHGDPESGIGRAVLRRRIVLEDQQMVEQPVRHRRGRLDLGQAGVVMRRGRPSAWRCSACSNPAKPCRGDRRTRTGTVLMKQPTRRSTPGIATERPETHGAEDDVPAVDPAPEQNAPECLEHGAERDTAARRQSRCGGSLALADAKAMHRRLRPGAAVGRPRQGGELVILRQQGRPMAARCPAGSRSASAAR